MPGVQEIVASAWPGRAAETRVLGDGLTDHSVLVALDGGERFVLHLSRSETAALGIDRRVELEATLAAAAVGIGPDVETFLEEHGCLITRYIEGVVVEPDRLRQPAALRRVALALRAFHSGPPLGRRFSSFAVVEAYRTTAFARGADVPAAYAWARQLARRVQAARGPAPERPCHNNLMPGNFVDDGDRIRIVDWEYAGMGDALFDLASLAVHLDLGGAELEALLLAYAGRAREQDLRALELLRFMVDYREAMWGVVQSAVSSLPVDYAAYAAARFARIEATAESAAFRAALGDG